MADLVDTEKLQVEVLAGKETAEAVGPVDKETHPEELPDGRAMHPAGDPRVAWVRRVVGRRPSCPNPANPPLPRPSPVPGATFHFVLEAVAADPLAVEEPLRSFRLLDILRDCIHRLSKHEQ